MDQQMELDMEMAAEEAQAATAGSLAIGGMPPDRGAALGLKPFKPKRITIEEARRQAAEMEAQEKFRDTSRLDALEAKLDRVVDVLGKALGAQQAPQPVPTEVPYLTYHPPMEETEAPSKNSSEDEPPVEPTESVPVEVPSTVHSDLEKWTAALTAEVEKRQGSDLSAWKKWRDGFWRLGLYKFDRWDPTLQKHTQESFELLIADPGFRAIIVNAVLAIEPGTVCVEKLFNFLSSTAGFMAFAQAATLLAANK